MMSDADRRALIAKNLDVLQALQNAPSDMTRTALAAEVGRDRSNLSKTFAVLEREGLVTLFAQDLPLLTAAGEAAIAATQAPAAGDADPYPLGKVSDIPLALIDRDPQLNPRTTFDDEELASLAASIAEKGVIQPILVRPYGAAEDGQADITGHFRIVAGERRWRASQLADAGTIPALVRELTDAQALEIALIENIQRVDLSPIEEARTFRRIIDAKKGADPAMTDARVKEVLAEATKKTTRYVEQRLTLLKLSPKDQARMELPSDHGNYLSLTNARYALQAHDQKLLRDQEKEAALAKYKITPLRLLLLAEIAEKINREPDKGHWSARTEVGFQAGGSDLDWLRKENLADVRQESLYGDVTKLGRFYAYMGWRAAEVLKAKAPEFAAAKSRPEALERMRQAALSGWTAAEGRNYATPWLNGPFDLTAEAAAAVELRQREADERQAATADAEAQKQRDKLFGRTLLRDTLQFVGHGPADQTAPSQAKLTELLAEAGGPLPWRLDEKGDIVDAMGQPLRASDAGLLARRLLLAHGVNALTGHATPQVPAELLRTLDSEKPVALDRPAFEQLIVQRWQAMAAERPEGGFELHAAAALDRYLQHADMVFGDEAEDWDDNTAAEIADGWMDDDKLAESNDAEQVAEAEA